MNTRTIISATPRRLVEVTHRDSDPGIWIVRAVRKGFFRNVQLSSDWFNDEGQAIAFAKGLSPGHAEGALS